MFNLFKTRSEHVEELMDAIRNNSYVKNVNPVDKDKPAYQIGKTEQGKITLSLGHDGTVTTLTMNDFGARQLIRMLEAAIETEETE